jgi:hypothetical protein
MAAEREPIRNMTYQEFGEALEGKFQSKMSESAVENQIQLERKKPDESFEEFASRLTELSRFLPGGERDPLPWVLDSGSSSHLCNSLKYFVTFKKWVRTVQCASDGQLQIKGVGMVHIPIRDEEGDVRILKLKNVYYTPEVVNNLLGMKWT